MLLRLFEHGCKGFGTAFTVDGAGDYATSIACPFAAGEQTLQSDVMQQLIVTGDAQRGGRAGLDTDDDGVVGEETASILAESPEAIAQAVGYKGRHPLVEPGWLNARQIGRRRDIA